jgi:hypothetical protein
MAFNSNTPGRPPFNVPLQNRAADYHGLIGWPDLAMQGPSHFAAARRPTADTGVLLARHDGQNSKNPPPVLPGESSARRKNILLSERQKL